MLSNSSLIMVSHYSQVIYIFKNTKKNQFYKLTEKRNTQNKSNLSNRSRGNLEEGKTCSRRKVNQASTNHRLRVAEGISRLLEERFLLERIIKRELQKGFLIAIIK